jgi:type II secretory pathway component PulK
MTYEQATHVLVGLISLMVCVIAGMIVRAVRRWRRETQRQAALQQVYLQEAQTVARTDGSGGPVMTDDCREERVVTQVSLPPVPPQVKR